MASVLVIGIGSTGLSVMEAAQQFYYEFTKKDSPGPNHSGFMFLETDRGRNIKVTPNRTTDIEPCLIATVNINATLNNWHQEQRSDWAWLPNTAEMINQGTGAGGLSVYGRLGLWANEQKVRDQINNLYRRIKGNRDTNIYIVGSFCGGTGSGIFLDLAYLVRQCTNNENIFGMFMLPGQQQVGDNNNDSLYENAYASLKTIDKYSQADEANNTNYRCVWPSGHDTSSLFAPFKNVQFVTPDFSNASASMRYEELIHSLGFNLVLRLLDVNDNSSPFQSAINARIIDYTHNVNKGIFFTIGFNMFQYPEALLEEYFATNLIEEELLKRWSDTEYFIDSLNVKQPINNVKSRIRVEVDKFLEDAIFKSIEHCQGMPIQGQSNFNNAILTEIQCMLNGNYRAPSLKHYEFGLFDVNRNDKFYPAIQAQNMSLRNYLIDSIAKYVEEESTKYQNLTIVNLILTELTEGIDRILKEWARKYKLDGTPATWNTNWSKNFEECFRGKFAYSLIKKEIDWYQEVLNGVAKLCYFNAFIPMLINIHDSILNINGIGVISSNTNSLPSISDLQNLNKKVANLLNPQKESIESRKNQIGGQLSQNTNPQLNYVFKTLSYQGDIVLAQVQYNNQSNKFTYSTITQQDLWSYLLKNDETQLKSNLISQSLVFVQGLCLFNDAKVVDIMMRYLTETHPLSKKVYTLFKDTKANIREETPAMSSLVNTEQFHQHTHLKLITASPLTETNENCITQQFKNDYKPTEATNEYVQIPSMKNTVVIYQEYGYLGQVNGVNKVFNPLIHLSYQQQVRAKLETKIEQGINAYDPKLRLAYINVGTLLDNQNIKIK